MTPGNLSPQQSAILRLALRNHRRWKTDLPRSWVEARSTWPKPPTLYSWEVMVRVYGVRLNPYAFIRARRISASRWEDGPHSMDDFTRRRYGAGLFHCFRCEVSEQPKIYADAKQQRVASASKSRAVRGLEKRGLLFSCWQRIHLTPLGAEVAGTLPVSEVARCDSINTRYRSAAGDTSLTGAGAAVAA